MERPSDISMEALEFSQGKLEFRQAAPEPKASAGEAIIQIEAAGICSTDLEIIKGYMGYEGIPGHEFVGRVIKGPAELIGKKAVAEINCVCGECKMCKTGLSSHCTNRETIGIYKHPGAFAERIAVPVDNIHVLNDNFSNDEAIFIEPLAAAFQICRQIDLSEYDKIAVIGDGRLGLLVIQALGTKVSKDNLVLLGRHQEKLDIIEKLGYQGFLPDELAIKPEWDVVVDCTGKTSGFETAVKMLRPRGTLVLKSTFVPDKSLDLSPVVVNEIKIIGSRCGPFEEAIRALQAGRVSTAGMITGKYKLKDGIEAFRAANESNHIKIKLEM